MSYVRDRRGFGASCDPATMVTSVNGNYQCCPSDTACVTEAGLAPSLDPTADAGGGIALALPYGNDAAPASSPWWLILLVAVLGAGVLTLSPS